MIGEHVEILSGYAFNSKEFNTNEEGIPLVRIRDVGKIRSKTYYTGKYSNKYILGNGDFLIGMDGDFRLAIWNGGKALLNQRVCKITPNESVFNSGYMYYMLPKELKRIEDTTSFATVKHLSVKKIKNIEIPLPPLDQQKKIAAILDAADAYRQKTKALIEKYDELTQSLFLDMFDSLAGDKISLSTICDINPKKSEISSVARSTLVSFMPMANVSVKGQVFHIEKKTIDEVWSGFTYFKENDVVFAKITPCMENGKGAIMRNLKNSIGFGTTEFHVLRPLKAHSTSEYLFHLTHSKHFRALAEVNMTGSAGQKRVPKDFFDKYKIVPPSIKLQNQFADSVKAIEAQKAQAQGSLDQAEDLFNSLLQRAFKGELTN